MTKKTNKQRLIDEPQLFVIYATPIYVKVKMTTYIKNVRCCCCFI